MAKGKPMKKGIIYLACPYSDAIGPVRETRAQIANRVAGDLIRKGHVVYSPISHCHGIAKECNLATTWEHWKEFNASDQDPWLEKFKRHQGRNGYRL
jgi:hypothetical protein